jgi:hypothetical protein
MRPLSLAVPTLLPAMLLAAAYLAQAAPDELKALDSTGRGTLKGKVTLDGDPPAAMIAAEDQRLAGLFQAHVDKNCCQSGSDMEKEQQAWRVNDGAVQNVVVWLRPPEGTYFRIDMDHPTWPKEVVMDQPHCAFLPHVVVLFLSYYDPATRKQKPTGQVFTVKNSAPVNHNVKWGGFENPGDNRILGPNKDLAIELVPSYRHPVPFECNIHPWMKAYAWAFEHPYAAVTNEKGEYEIKGVPAGVELQVVAWHESVGWVTEGRANGEAIKLKEGDNTRDFKVKAK